MFYPSEQEFTKLAKKGNLIPVYKEIVADMETPVSAYKKIEGENSFLLESIEGGENIARYSFLGSNPLKILKFKSGQDPFPKIKKFMAQFQPVRLPGLPRFHGGIIGYFSYDTVRFIENIPAKNPDELKIPDVQFMYTDTILAFDHVKHKIVIISNAHIKSDPEKAYREAVGKIKALEKKLKRTLRSTEFEVPLSEKKEIKVASNFTKEEFMGIVKKAKEYIRAGDIIQVVPSQRFSCGFKGNAFNVYRILRTINPSPYMYYLKFGGFKVVGSSPEVMVRFEDGKAVIRPIAGTRPRGTNEAEDTRLARELLASEKEKAEHIMLVDLARNDLGRVCEPKSVEVTELMTIERYSHVMHIVSNVTGTLQKDKDAIDLFRASFPAGTVSGAPKVRAMEIIDELENTKRGPYAGAVGYFSFSGEMDTCITIRTILLLKGKAYVQAGGGVVADSDPEAEFEETRNKARGMLKAVELAQ
ncbi:MAG TPA: anthranilate synthase component I [Candidatus Omnitrophota bacterium]|nr:anthranilate synthase component I [Candidatus Omnitrophota bacterium]